MRNNYIKSMEDLTQVDFSKFKEAKSDFDLVTFEEIIKVNEFRIWLARKENK